MFKKITALLLLTTFTHVYAVTPIEQSRAIANELNRTFDELNYKLNVEWDQKDQNYFDRSVTEFENEISALQAEGLTSKDLVDHAISKIKDKSIKTEVNELAKTINENQMSPEEARAFTISKLSSTYAHGASWSGSRMGIHAGILIAAIIVILICCNKNDKPSKPQHDRDSKPGMDHCYPSHDGQYGMYSQGQCVM